MLRLVALWLGLSSANLPCPVDAGLATAAARLVKLPAAPTPADLEQALRAAGSDLPGTKALRFPSADRQSLQKWFAELLTLQDAPLVCAVAPGAQHSIAIAAFRAGSLQLRRGHPTPRLQMQLASGFTQPRLVLRLRSGKLHSQRLSLQQLGAGFNLSQLPEPVVRAQLLASGPRGMRPVAELDLTAPDAQRVDLARGDAGAPTAVSKAAAQPAAAQVTAAKPTTMPGPRLAVKLDVRQAVRLRDEVEELRRQKQLPPLRRHRLLRTAAEEHASAVCASGIVAHELAPQQGPEQRLKKKGVQARAVGEAVAAASNFTDASLKLRDSPSHLLALLDRRFTDVGYASASNSAGRTCVVVMLAAWPRYVPP